MSMELQQLRVTRFHFNRLMIFYKKTYLHQTKLLEK